jgi:hypothetical protein
LRRQFSQDTLRVTALPDSNRNLTNTQFNCRSRLARDGRQR